MENSSYSLILFLFIISRGSRAISQMESDYPNPRTHPKSCYRHVPSFICDPDSILTEKQANKLDYLVTEMIRSTPCLCSKCHGGNRGPSIGILIKYNFTHHSQNMSSTELSKMAQIIRDKWAFGVCGDDILILVLTQSKQAEVDIGPTIERAISKKLARQIFDDCIGHFENDHFYQGLESMVNSYSDSLRRIDPTKSPTIPSSKTGLIVGLSLGIVVLILVLAAAALIRCRQIRHTNRGNRKPPTPTGMEYRLCTPDDEKNDDGCSYSSDEGIDSDEELKNFEVPTLQLPKFQDVFQRQLSVVNEENEEEFEAVQFAMTHKPKNSKTHVTEL